MKERILTKEDCRVFRIGILFYLYRTDGLFWFRFLGGYGVHGKNTLKRDMLFSDRNCKRLRIGKWIFKILKP